MSVTDPFFVTFLKHVAKLVDINTEKRKPLVADFGCGDGLTTALMSLVGAHAIGIDMWTTNDEALKFVEFSNYCHELFKKLGDPREFECGLRIGRDITKLHTYRKTGSTDFPDRCLNSIFMGNFLHMFDPETSQKIVREQAHRMLLPGGTIFASVDGITAGGGNKCQATYLQAKGEGRRFPSVMAHTEYGILADTAIVPIPTLGITLSYADVDEKGHTTPPCRFMEAKQGFYQGESFNGITDGKPYALTKGAALTLHALKRIVCYYDQNLIDFVFPASQWIFTIVKRDKSELNVIGDVPDENVFKWNIIATKL